MALKKLPEKVTLSWKHVSLVCKGMISENVYCNMLQATIQ